MTPSELTVRKVSHRGRAREWVLNPLWVRLDKVVHEEFGIERLFLVSRGKQAGDRQFPRSRRESELRQGAWPARSARPNAGVTRTRHPERQEIGWFAPAARPR